MRISKSLTIEPDISSYVDATKDERFAGDRVNELLRRAMLPEQYDRLEADAAEFFADARSERAAPKALQKASFSDILHGLARARPMSCSLSSI